VIIFNALPEREYTICFGDSRTLKTNNSNLYNTTPSSGAFKAGVAFAVFLQKPRQL